MNKKIKKLTLNRETVRSLTDDELSQVAGGATGITECRPPRACSVRTCITDCTLCSLCCP